MIRKIGLVIVVLLLLGYLVVAITAFNVRPVDQVCHALDLVIKDSVNAGFMTKGEVLSILNKHNVNPVGQKMNEVMLDTLEEILNKHPLIDEVECFKAPSGKVFVEVTQRVPIFRVINQNGETYFVDNKATIMPPGAKCVAYLPVVTGYVEKSFALTELFRFAVFLQKNKFWNAQIEQINVRKDQGIELVPRVGDHIVFLGRIDDYENKLMRLKEFYMKGLNKVGWNKYNRINLEFSNQIICTKKEK